MAYNRKNLLKKAIIAQEADRRARKKGISSKFMFYNEVQDRLLCSYSTFNNYLAIENPEEELKRIEAREARAAAEKKRQLKLEF